MQSPPTYILFLSLNDLIAAAEQRTAHRMHIQILQTQESRASLPISHVTSAVFVTTHGADHGCGGLVEILAARIVIERAQIWPQDQRSSQIYDAIVERAEAIEAALKEELSARGYVVEAGIVCAPGLLEDLQKVQAHGDNRWTINQNGDDACTRTLTFAAPHTAP